MPAPLPPEPEMVSRPGRVDFQWKAEGYRISIRRLHTHSSGRVTGHIIIRSEEPNLPGLLYRADLNLSAARSKREVAKELSASPIWDWYKAIELICDRTLNWLEEGDPVERSFIDPEILVPPPEYLLHPLAPLGMPTVLYGDGGSAKSTLAVGLGICCLLPWEGNPFGLVPLTRPVVPLFLDWEMDLATFRYRTQLFLRGHRLPGIEMLYRRCYLPLVQDLEHLQDFVADNQVEVVIIDSLGAACGGELNKSEGPLAFYGGLRQLGKTSIIVAHTSKDRDADRGIYGNVHFSNYARSVWECRKEQIAGALDLDLALIDRKSNLSSFRHPIGYRFTFDNSNQSLTVSSTDPGSVQGVIARLGLKAEILDALRSSPRSAANLFKELGREAQVRARLSELKRAGKLITLPDGSWALPYTGEPL